MATKEPGEVRDLPVAQSKPNVRAPYLGATVLFRCPRMGFIPVVVDRVEGHGRISGVRFSSTENPHTRSVRGVPYSAKDANAWCWPDEAAAEIAKAAEESAKRAAAVAKNPEPAALAS